MLKSFFRRRHGNSSGGSKPMDSLEEVQCFDESEVLVDVEQVVPLPKKSGGPADMPAERRKPGRPKLVDPYGIDGAKHHLVVSDGVWKYLTLLSFVYGCSTVRVIGELARAEFVRRESEIRAMLSDLELE